MNQNYLDEDQISDCPLRWKRDEHVLSYGSILSSNHLIYNLLNCEVIITHPSSQMSTLLRCSFSEDHKASDSPGSLSHSRFRLHLHHNCTPYLPVCVLYSSLWKVLLFDCFIMLQTLSNFCSYVIPPSQTSSSIFCLIFTFFASFLLEMREKSYRIIKSKILWYI